MPKQRLLVEGSVFYIERPRSWPSEFTEDTPPELGGWNYAFSLAFICPRCLTRWAVLSFEGEEELHIQGHWCAKHRPERAHNLWNSNRPYVPGSLFPTYVIDRPLLAVLPKPLLRREFELTMKRMEMENG